MPEKPFEIYEEDFVKTIMDYEMYKRGINVKDFNDKLLKKVLYSSQINKKNEDINIILKGGNSNE